MSGFSVVILAAGEGKRFHSKTPKVFHLLCGRPVVSYIVDTAMELNPHRVVMVVQKGSTPNIDGVEFVIQKVPRGTGDALLVAEPLVGEEEDVLVLPGDVPLVASSTLLSLIKSHGGNSCTILTTLLEDPTSYGRVLKDREEVVKIVEERDATQKEKEIKEVNTGIYIFKTSVVFESLRCLSPENAQREYYLTDVIGIMKDKGYRVESFLAHDSEEVIGVNDRSVLSYVSEILQKKIIRRHQLKGITISPPIAIDYDVKIGKDTIIHPFTALYGNTVIGEGCTIGPNVVIIDSNIPPGTVVKPFSIVNRQGVK
jgi:bifunctional UDP-N-acetylglucosamine pyrophosphorylase/glucosamine-1-phosphate N-acetyltransferase